jgi:N-acetylneuraminate synthase
MSFILIPEIAQSHDGSMGMLYSYIDRIKEAGCEYVKFQTHFAEEESSEFEPWRVKFSRQDKTRYDYWKRMEFTEKQWIEIGKYVHSKGMKFVSSPFSVKAVDVLNKAKVDIWKIASGEINNFLMLEEIAKSRKPVILSTGMSDLKEIDRTIKYLKERKVKYSILQCTSNYPVKEDRVGLNLIEYFKKKYKCPAGISDHSGNIYTGLAAATLGADIVEVHVTISKRMFGPDVPSSLTFEELKVLKEGSDWIRKVTDNPVDKNVLAKDFKGMRDIFMKSVFVRKAVNKGVIITKENIVLKKPMLGIPASDVYKVIGKKARRNIKNGEYLKKGDV